jgi:cell wall-associated NlpC family hydrolase
MFSAADGVVHHVTMYAGRGRMVQAPHTGSSVETVPTTKVGYVGALLPAPASAFSADQSVGRGPHR